MARTGENYPTSWQNAIYLGDEKLASNYGDVSGKFLVRNPLKINAKEVLHDDYLNAKTGDSYDEWLQSIEDSFGIYGFMEQGFTHFKDVAKKAGNDSVVIDFSGLPVKEKRVAFTSDPTAIRHVEAAFDPAKKDSSNLLAGAATIGGVGASAALTPQDSYAGVAEGMGVNKIRTGREQLEAMRRREDYLAKIDMLNKDQIKAPNSEFGLGLSALAGQYNTARKQYVNPALDAILPAGELPQDYLEKLSYGDKITWQDRLKAVGGMF
jgi:hypothetical protein